MHGRPIRTSLGSEPYGSALVCLTLALSMLYLSSCSTFALLYEEVRYQQTLEYIPLVSKSIRILNFGKKQSPEKVTAPRL